MAYKFQAGDATLSGSVTLVAYQDLLFEFDGSSDIGTAASEVGVTYTTRLTASVGISGSAIYADNYYGNGSNLSGLSSTTMSVTSSNLAGALNLVLVQGTGTGKTLAADSATGLIFQPSTNALTTKGAISGSGGLSALDLTLNGGSWAADGDLAAGEVSGSDTLAGKSIVLGQNGVIGATGDTDLLKLATNTLTVAGDVDATNLSGSDTLAGKSIVLGQNGVIGATGDTDLMTLSSNSVVVAGAISGSDALSGKSIVLGQNGNIGAKGDTDLITLSSNSVVIAGALSGSGTLSAAGAVQLDGADDGVAFVAADDVYFRDAGSGQMRRDSWSDIMEVTAGDGITNTSGVLSVAGNQNIDIDTIGNASRQLTSAGMNYATASITVNRTFTLPASPSSGDIVYIKLAGVNSGKHVVISGSGMHMIDGVSTLTASSAYAGISLCYVASNVWRIF